MPGSQNLFGQTEQFVLHVQNLTDTVALTISVVKWVPLAESVSRLSFGAGINCRICFIFTSHPSVY